ncbi:MAG: CidA/LrgA family protein [Rhodobacteraceae bacterium]|nr:CidA/LrgA family protein [Paracoccaceae bacterium]
MIPAFSILLSCQLAGEIVVRALALPLPGPVLGMVFLVSLLFAVPRLVGTIRATAEALLSHLSLLFVPAGTGIVAYLGLLGSDGAALLAAIVVSTLAGLAVTALTFVAVARMTRPRS